MQFEYQKRTLRRYPLDEELSTQMTGSATKPKPTLFEIK